MEKMGHLAHSSEGPRSWHQLLLSSGERLLSKSQGDGTIAGYMGEGEITRWDQKQESQGPAPLLQNQPGPMRTAVILSEPTIEPASTGPHLWKVLPPLHVATLRTKLPAQKVFGGKLKPQHRPSIPFQTVLKAILLHRRNRFQCPTTQQGNHSLQSPIIYLWGTGREELQGSKHKQMIRKWKC